MTVSRKLVSSRISPFFISKYFFPLWDSFFGKYNGKDGSMVVVDIPSLKSKILERDVVFILYYTSQIGRMGGLTGQT